jgi:hypothetical protein
MMKEPNIDEKAGQRIIEHLNSLAESDPVAISKLVTTRVPCDNDLATRKDVVVYVARGHGPELGLLGVLSGFIDLKRERIMMTFGEDGAFFFLATPESHPAFFDGNAISDGLIKQELNKS